jgi:hypothetical protein
MSQQVELQAQIVRSMNTELFQIANDGSKFLMVNTKVSRSSAELSFDAVLNASEKEEQRKSSGAFWHLVKQPETQNLKKIEAPPKILSHEEISMPMTEALFGTAAFLMKTGR